MLVTEETYAEALTHLTQGGEVTCDTETNGVDWRGVSHLVGLCLLAGERSFYFPFRHEYGPNLPENLIGDVVSRVLPPERHQVGFHYAFDIAILRKEGMEMPTSIEDSQLGAHVLNENEAGFYKLEELCERYTDPEAGNEEKALVDKLVGRFGGARSTAKKNLWRLAPAEVAEYGEQDLWSTRGLRDWQRPHLKSWKLEEVYQGVCQYQLVICGMQDRGMLLDVPLVHQLMEGNAPRIEAETVKLRAAAGYECNPNSPKQMGALLGIPSTAHEILEPMAAGGYELAQTLIDYRIYAKATSTYYRPFLRHIDKHNVLRGEINAMGTYTGRPTCAAPNLLAIPRDKTKYPIKQIFIARPGFEILEADISQAEMRVAAHYAQEQGMMRILRSGVDVHSGVAQEMGVPRHIAKNINFSVIYGIGPVAFARTYKIPLADARRYLAQYHETYPGFRRLANLGEETGIRKGFIRMFTGRVRHFNHPTRAPAWKALNNLVQGSVSEVIRIAMVRLARECPWAHQLLSVYDSILFEVPKDATPEMLERLRSIMEDQPWCSLPLPVDMAKGRSWGELTEVPRAA